MPVTLSILALLLVARSTLARRPVLLTGRTLTVLIAIAALLDLALGFSSGGTPIVPMIAVLSMCGAYPTQKRAVLVLRASRTELNAAVRRAATMVRLDLDGASGRYAARGIESPSAVTVRTWDSWLHHVTFGSSLDHRKGKLFRSVLSKQFGRLVPIFIRVRS